ncbi:MAG: hypothetical protein LBI77_03335, partial [Puniceicoccales bacterium]|nr:hypothetical protein [Puniceicoccales bacterium]
PERGLKHLFRDPLVLQRGKIQSALLSFHVDRIQRRGDGSGNVVVGGKIFAMGALLNEHPKIRLEKVGKRSLYFSDKYGQQYKRSIENLLE